jgi:hypothetical protein
MTALRVRMLLLAFATGSLLGQSWTAHAASIEYFPNLCSDLRNGMPLVDIETMLLARGYTDGDAGTFTGHMVLQHCPDQVENVRGQLR